MAAESDPATVELEGTCAYRMAAPTPSGRGHWQHDMPSANITTNIGKMCVSRKHLRTKHPDERFNGTTVNDGSFGGLILERQCAQNAGRGSLYPGIHASQQSY